jgi:hypothetical protein
MALDFGDRWDIDNTAKPTLDKGAIAAKVAEALSTYDGQDADFQSVKGRTLSKSPLSRITLTKGLRIAAGDDPFEEAFVTLEIADWPRAKRFCLYFTYLDGGKEPADWYPSKLTYVDSADDKPLKSWSII